LHPNIRDRRIIPRLRWLLFPQNKIVDRKALTLLIGIIGDFSWLAHQEISQSQYFFPLPCRLILPKEAAAEVTQPGPTVLELLAARQEA
jgi:hypothetical protein